MLEPRTAPPSIAPAKMQLIAFPYAGANAFCYKTLGQALPEFVSLATYELPGHGRRRREALCRRFEALVDEVIERLGPSFESVYAFYGHSFGAWLACDVTQRLAELGRPLPSRLFVSGARAPQSTALRQPLHQAPSSQLRARLAEWGGIPRPVLEDADLMALFERVLRADFEALETREQRARSPLPLPIHLALGRDDDITDEQACAWQLETRQPLSTSYFSGGHFFIHEHAIELAALIGRELGIVAHRSEVGWIG